MIFCFTSVSHEICAIVSELMVRVTRKCMDPPSRFGLRINTLSLIKTRTRFSRIYSRSYALCSTSWPCKLFLSFDSKRTPSKRRRCGQKKVMLCTNAICYLLYPICSTTYLPYSKRSVAGPKRLRTLSQAFQLK